MSHHRTTMLAGALAGIVAGLVFATAHALLIVPIWTRMGAGLAFAAAAGAMAGWALSELSPERTGDATATAAGRGAVFGATLWALVAPVTAADALLRLLGLTQRYELLAVAVAVLLAAAAGATYGWHRTHRRRAALAGGLATLSLTIAMAGPVPVGRSARAFAIFVAVLPACVAGGALLAILARWLGTRGGAR